MLYDIFRDHIINILLIIHTVCGPTDVVYQFIEGPDNLSPTPSFGRPGGRELGLGLSIDKHIHNKLYITEIPIYNSSR